MKKINNPFINLLLIIGLFQYIYSKSILIANDISNGKFISETNEYIFNIKASLTGILSKNMFENINIIINNDNKLKTICKFPEEKINVYNKTIIINCSINNMIYDKFSISFKGINNYIDLINFNENILYVDKELFNNDIILMMGEIKEQKCQKNNELYYYNYKIKIENKTIPKILEKYNYNYDLKPNGLNNNQYNITCNIINNNIDKYINCFLIYNKHNNNILYYEQKYIYHKEMNNNNIYIINNNDNLYIGENINCEYINKINNNIYKLELRFLEDSTDYLGSSEEEDSYSDTINTDTIDTTTDTIVCNNNSYKVNNQCLNCLSICKTCKSLNECTDCKKGYFLNNTECDSCFSKFNGCETCDQSGCSKCYNNNFFQYNLNNNQCDEVKESKNSTIIEEVKLKFVRIDSYIKNSGNEVSFNCHFILLNYYLSGAKLIINATITTSNRLRNLEEINNKSIECVQYGDAFGKYNDGYLANFKCKFDLGNMKILVSIKINKFSINNKEIEDDKTKQYNINDLNATSLDAGYRDNTFLLYIISNITDVKLKNELSFNINGKYESNKTTDNDKYDITFKKSNNEEITGTCTAKKDSQTLSCTIPKDNIKEKETLAIEEGIYEPYQNKELLILINQNEEKIKVPKKGISIGAIVGITIAGIVVLIPFIFYLAKYLIGKKENNIINPYDERDIEIDRDDNKYQGPKNEGSKQIIFNNN